MLASIASMSQAITDDEIDTFVDAQLAITNLYDRVSTCTASPCVAADATCTVAPDTGSDPTASNDASVSFDKATYPNDHEVAFVHLPKSG